MMRGQGARGAMGAVTRAHHHDLLRVLLRLEHHDVHFGAEQAAQLHQPAARKYNNTQ